MTTTELHRHPLALYRAEARAREFSALLQRVRDYLQPPGWAQHTGSSPLPVTSGDSASPPDLETALHLLESLAYYLNHPLLAGDTFALDSELHRLAFFEHVQPGQHELVVATHHHIHLLRMETDTSTSHRFSDWKTPLLGHPIGLTSQPVGHLGSQEIIALSAETLPSNGHRLHEYRLAPCAGASLAVVHQMSERMPPPIAVGQTVPGVERPLQIEVHRVGLRSERPQYQLRIRRHAAEDWTTLHSAQHPILNPFYDGKTLYFTARNAQIMGIRDPLQSASRPFELLTLQTPSPVQALLGYPSPSGQLLLAATADGTLFAIDPVDYRLRWKFDTKHSLIAAAFIHNRGSLPLNPLGPPSASADAQMLVIGTPDGLLQIFYPIDTDRLWALIDALLERTRLTLRELLERVVPSFSDRVPDNGSTGVDVRALVALERAVDRPYLRLLVVDRLLNSREQDPRLMAALRDALLLAFKAAERGSRLWQSEIIRFLSYQFFRLIHQSGDGGTSRTSDPPELPQIAMLFGVLERLATPAYGDARRRLERLLRRLRDEWLGPERYETYRSQYAPHLSLADLSAYNLRTDAHRHLRRAESCDDVPEERTHLFRALVATWRRSLNPLNRVFSLQGILQAVQVGGLTPSPEAGMSERGWLVGLHPEALQLFRFTADVLTPTLVEHFPLHSGLRISSEFMPSLGCQLIAVARADRISFFKFEQLGDEGHLYALPIEDLACDEPVTVMELLRLPVAPRPSGQPPTTTAYETVLTLGQADGRFLLLRLKPIPEPASEVGSRLRFVPELDLHWTTPVHHVALAQWPTEPGLLVGADRVLHLYQSIYIDADGLHYQFQQLQLESTITAFTAAAPPPRQGPPPVPVLVLGLANGMVQAFCPPPTPESGPELAWLYRAPQVITDLVYVHDHTGGWFVAAADDGILHLLRYGEPHHRVAVERYPYDLTPIRLPGSEQSFLMVSSPNRAVTVLEVTGPTAFEQLEMIGRRMDTLLPRENLSRALDHASDPALFAIGVYLLRQAQLDVLTSFAEESCKALYRDAWLAGTFLRALMDRVPLEPEARVRAYAFFKKVMMEPGSPIQTRISLLNVLADTLDRLEEEELELLLHPFPLEDPQVTRTYVKTLEHLWDRTQHQHIDPLLWWRGIHRLGVTADNFDRRQLLPVIGTFARKLLQVGRHNVLARLVYLRELEENGLFVARVVCEALALSHVLGDPVLSECISQYALLLHAQSPEQIQRVLTLRRDSLLSKEHALPEAAAARGVYDDLLEAFDYAEYDQYSCFLVDAPEFLPRARLDYASNANVFAAFNEVRSRLIALTPSQNSERSPLSQFQDRVQALSAQAEHLMDFVRRWGGTGTLEQQTVAAIVGRWRERILLPEIRRLQESVELSLRDFRVVVPDDGGLADVTVRIHNLGGRPLDGVTVTLATSANANYLWEGTPQWCPGPIQFGQAVDYHTEVLVAEQADRLTLHFELTWQDQGREQHRIIPMTSRVEREEGGQTARAPNSYRLAFPYTFDTLRAHLTRVEGGQLFMLVSEDTSHREQLLMELTESLERGQDATKRTLLLLDVPGLLEGPPRATLEVLPSWWLPEKLLRLLVERGLLPQMPDRAELRADPFTVLERSLHLSLESTRELWLVLRRSNRAFSVLKYQTLETLRAFLVPLLSHSSHRVRGLIGGDFSQLVRFSLAPSPLAGKVQGLDVDQPFPFESPRSRAEHIQHVQEYFQAARVTTSELIRNKLLAHVGWNIGLLKRLLGGRLDSLRQEAWLNWQRGERDAQGEPDELDSFLNSLINQSSNNLRNRFAALPFFHRLMLTAVASATIKPNRKELREGMVLASEVNTTVKVRGNRSKRLYPAHSVLLDGDAQYLKVTVGDTQEEPDFGLFRGLNHGVSLSHLLQAMGHHALLNDLEHLGLVKRLTLGSETYTQLRVPILRRWLVKTHPFEPREELNIRRRVFEDGVVSTLIPLNVYSEMPTRLSSGRNLLQEFQVFIGLMEEDARKGTQAWEQGSKRWDRLMAVARRYSNWLNKPTTEHFRLLMAEWGNHVGCKVEMLTEDLEEGIFVARMDLVGLRIPKLGSALLMGMSRELTSLRAERLRELVRREGLLHALDEDDMHAGAMGLMLFPLLPHNTGQPAPASLELAYERYRELLGERIIPLTERDLTSTALAEEGRRDFLDLLTRGGFKLSHISPYQLTGPLKGRAMDVLFVGREDEIDYVLRHPDQQVAIVGSRRIGKTSLLLKLKQELTSHLGEKARVVYIDCVDLAPQQVWRAITDGLKLEPVTLEDARLSLRRQLDQIRHPVVLLLDEIDGLYGSPAQNREEGAERLMWDMRSLAASGVLRLIVAGYIRIYERRRDPRSAFHNFTTFRRLSALSVEAARALVRGPISALNLEFSPENLIDQILERTYRVPWIIQLFCNQLIVRLDERLNRSKRFDRRIHKDDIDGVSVQIEEELYTHLTNSRVMTATDQILLLTMVEAGVHTFTEKELVDRLESRFGDAVWDALRFEDLTRNLENLTLTLALTVESGVYSFPLEMYPTVIRSRLGDVRPRLERLYDTLNRGSF